MIQTAFLCVGGFIGKEDRGRKRVSLCTCMFVCGRGRVRVVRNGREGGGELSGNGDG